MWETPVETLELDLKNLLPLFLAAEVSGLEFNDVVFGLGFAFGCFFGHGTSLELLDWVFVLSDSPFDETSSKYLTRAGTDFRAFS